MGGWSQPQLVQHIHQPSRLNGCPCQCSKAASPPVLLTAANDTVRAFGRARAMAPVREFTKIRYVEYLDLPTGHWPQFTRPEELGRAILARVEGAAPREPAS
jgi:hypothetical protein